MDGQLRLIAEGTGVEPVIFDVDMTPEQLERFRALSEGERMEFEVRAPGALAEVVDRIGYLTGLQTFELQHLATDLQRDLHRVRLVLAERRDDERCPRCHLHPRSGHRAGCPFADARSPEGQPADGD